MLRARVQTSRAQGSKMVFLNLRQRTDSVQALLVVTPEKVSKQMVKWAAGLADESIVLVEGVIAKAPEPIKSASVSDVEIHVSKVLSLSSKSPLVMLMCRYSFISFLGWRRAFRSPLKMLRAQSRPVMNRRTRMTRSKMTCKLRRTLLNPNLIAYCSRLV